jgi:hypothetical protein
VANCVASTAKRGFVLLGSDPAALMICFASGDVAIDESRVAFVKLLIWMW